MTTPPVIAQAPPVWGYWRTGFVSWAMWPGRKRRVPSKIGQPKFAPLALRRGFMSTSSRRFSPTSAIRIRLRSIEKRNGLRRPRA
jgi:hypothetical protein